VIAVNVVSLSASDERLKNISAMLSEGDLALSLSTCVSLSFCLAADQNLM